MNAIANTVEVKEFQIKGTDLGEVIVRGSEKGFSVKTLAYIRGSMQNGRADLNADGVRALIEALQLLLAEHS